jgi:hypothetical protein
MVEKKMSFRLPDQLVDSQLKEWGQKQYLRSKQHEKTKPGASNTSPIAFTTQTDISLQWLTLSCHAHYVVEVASPDLQDAWAYPDLRLQVDCAQPRGDLVGA